MNIDGSSLLSLFSSPESLEGLQQTLQLEGEMPQEFANVLMQKLTQLKDLNLDESVNLNLSDNLNTLHEFAGLLNEKGSISGFSSLFGNKLPLAGNLEKEIDLEDTLQALESVMDTLREVDIEGFNLEKLDSGQVLADITSLEKSLDAVLPSSWIKTAEIIAENKKVSADQLQLDSTIEKNDELIIASQMSAIVTMLNDQPVEAEVKASLTAGQVLESTNKKETLLSQPVDKESVLSLSEKKEGDNAFQQQERGSSKPTQDLAFISAKQHDQVEIPENADTDLSKDKGIPKFATDIANLNRAIMHETKAEIPPMTKHFAHPEWNKEIGERVIWMHKQKMPSAELRLNPRHLGPVTIKLDVTQDQANISFIAQHAAVKEAIEAAIPKLREMFSAQQLNLADVNVTQDDSSQKQSRGFDQMGHGSGQNGKNARETLGDETQDHSMDIAEEIEAGRAIASKGILSIFA